MKSTTCHWIKYQQILLFKKMHLSLGSFAKKYFEYSFIHIASGNMKRRNRENRSGQKLFDIIIPQS
jgi:hypothetical protein